MNAPREFVELPRGMRERIEGAIESLIALLDAIDEDTDFEAEPDEEEGGGDLEPSIGSWGGVNQSGCGGVGDAIDAEGPATTALPMVTPSTSSTAKRRKGLGFHDTRDARVEVEAREARSAPFAD